MDKERQKRASEQENGKKNRPLRTTDGTRLGGKAAKSKASASSARVRDGEDVARGAGTPAASQKRAERIKRILAPQATDSNAGEYSLKTQHTFVAPLLCAAVYLLLLITRTVKFGGVESTATETYLSLVAIQLFVFMLPSVFYIRFRSLDMREDVRLRLPAPDKIMFCVLCALVLIVMSMLVSALGGAFGSSVYSRVSVSALAESTDGGAGLVYYAVCFAVIPAVCEELLFRGIIMSEYQRSSIFTAVTANSLFFAMLHFDPANLPFYFLAGIVLSMCAYAANSIIASGCVHLMFNLFALFGGGIVENVVGSIGELTLIIIALFTLLLLFLTLTFGECQRIYASKAKRNKDSSYVVKYKKGTGAIRFFSAILSPMSLVCVVIFAVAALLIK